VQEIFLFVTAVVKLLHEDGWLSPEAQEGFFALFDLPFDLGNTKMLSSKLNGMHMHKSYTLLFRHTLKV
jgi:hypothetical protein